MSLIGNNANLFFTLAGSSAEPPVNWGDVSVLASFDDGAVQANITSSQFEFVNESAQQILAYIQGGLDNSSVGIFEGMPIGVGASNINGNISLLKAVLDFTKDFEVLSPVRVRARLRKDDGSNSLAERLDGITFGLLDEQGYMGNYTDVPYIVEKENTAVEMIVLGLSIYTLNREIYATVKRVVQIIADAVSHSIGGLPVPTAPASGILYTIAMLILETAFSVLMVIALKKLMDDFVEQLFPPIQSHKAMTLKQGLNAIAVKLGYNLQTDIPYLDTVYFLPSKPTITGAIEKGIPNPSDFGYQASEFIEVLKKMFFAKVAVIGNDLHFRPEFDPFWQTSSTYVMPSTVEMESYTYNAIEQKSNTLITFEFDEADKYTMDNFTGTSYEIFERPANYTVEKNILTKGLNETRIPYAHGNSKTELTEIEKLAKGFAEIGDTIVNLFGGKGKAAAKIKGRIGMFKVSQHQFYRAKLLYLKNGKLPSNHRDLWNAQVLWDNYISHSSFLLHNYYGQKKMFTGVRIPLGMINFLELTANNRITVPGQGVGEVTKFEWFPEEDYAIVDFFIRTPYTKNLIISTING